MSYIDDCPDTAGKCRIAAQRVDLPRGGRGFPGGPQLLKPLQNGLGHFLQSGIQGIRVAMTVGEIRRYCTEPGVLNVVNHNRISHWELLLSR